MAFSLLKFSRFALATHWTAPILLGGLLAVSLVGCGGAGGPSSDAGVVQTPASLRSGALRLDLNAAPIGWMGEAYRAVVPFDGGVAPYQFQITNGELPPGLSLDPAAGVFQGVPTRVGQFAVTVRVLDATGQSTTGPLTFTMVEPDGAAVTDPNKLASQSDGFSIPKKSAKSAVVGDGASFLGGPGRVDALLPGLNGLLATIPEGSWVNATLNQFQSVWTPEAQRPIESHGGGVGLPRAIIGAWSGFAWDANRGDLIIYGGGHANYAGNEVYRWRGATRVWERASLPSEISKDPLGNWRAIDGPDNAPVSAHTYDNNVFLPVLDRFITFGGAAYQNGSVYLRDAGNGTSRKTGPYVWDPAKADPNKVGGTTGSHVQRVAPYPGVTGGQMWQNRDLMLNVGGSLAPMDHLEGCTAQTIEGGKDVVYIGTRYGGGTSSQLVKYVINDVTNPGLDSIVKVGGVTTLEGQTACAFDPVQKLFLRLGSASGPFRMWNLNGTLGDTNLLTKIIYSEAGGELASKLASGAIDIKKCGFDFDPVRRKYALWCGGTELWMLTPPSAVSASGWVLQKVALPGGSVPTATTAASTGVLGKWKYIPNIDAFMALQDSTMGNIWLFKPVGWQAQGGGGNIPPSVSLSSPVAGQNFVVGSAINVAANTNDLDGSVVKVDFYDGVTPIGTVTQSPWQLTWSGAALGAHTIYAVATDNSGASTTSLSVNVSVSSVNVPPSLTISSPQPGQTFNQGQPIVIAAVPIDSDGFIAKVDFFDGATLIGTTTQAPWQFSWVGASVGGHSLTGVVTDNAGGVATSASVSIQVNAVNQAPTISLLSPTNGQTFQIGQAINLLANPADPEGQIASVEFLDGATVLATLNAAPWQWSVTDANLGVHSLTARVTDQAGNVTISNIANVQVSAGGGGATVAILQDGLNGYTGTRDAYLYSYWPTVALGAKVSMIEEGAYSTPMVRFAIFNRDGGPVPDNAVVSSAKLAIYKSSSYGATFTANRILCDWVETEVTWQRCRVGTNWQLMGGAGSGTDFAVLSDGAGTVGSSAGQWLEIDVTTGLSAMQNVGAANFGWRLKRSAGDNINQKSFYTRNFVTDINLRPKLTVSYTVN